MKLYFANKTYVKITSAAYQLRVTLTHLSRSFPQSKVTSLPSAQSVTRFTQSHFHRLPPMKTNLAFRTLLKSSGRHSMALSSSIKTRWYCIEKNTSSGSDSKRLFFKFNVSMYVNEENTALSNDFILLSSKNNPPISRKFSNAFG